MKVSNVAPDVADIEVPEPLRELPAWLMWRFEQFHGEAKPRKIELKKYSKTLRKRVVFKEAKK